MKRILFLLVLALSGTICGAGNLVQQLESTFKQAKTESGNSLSLENPFVSLIDNVCTDQSGQIDSVKKMNVEINCSALQNEINQEAEKFERQVAPFKDALDLLNKRRAFKEKMDGDNILSPHEYVSYEVVNAALPKAVEGEYASRMYQTFQQENSSLHLDIAGKFILKLSRDTCFVKMSEHKNLFGCGVSLSLAQDEQCDMSTCKSLEALYEVLGEKDKKALDSQWEQMKSYWFVRRDEFKELGPFLESMKAHFQWLEQLKKDYKDGEALQGRLGLKNSNEWLFVKGLVEINGKRDSYGWGSLAWQAAQKYNISNRRLGELLGGEGRTDEQNLLFANVVGKFDLYNKNIGLDRKTELENALQEDIDDSCVERVRGLVEEVDSGEEVDGEKGHYTFNIFGSKNPGDYADAHKLYRAIYHKKAEELRHKIKRYDYEQVQPSYRRTTAIGMGGGAAMTALVGSLALIYHVKVKKLRRLIARRLNISNAKVSVEQMGAVLRKLADEGVLSKKKVRALMHDIQRLRRLITARKRLGWGSAALAGLTGAFGAVRTIRGPKDPGAFDYDRIT